MVLEIALTNGNDPSVRREVTDAVGRYHFKNLSRAIPKVSLNRWGD